MKNNDMRLTLDIFQSDTTSDSREIIKLITQNKTNQINFKHFSKTHQINLKHFSKTHHKLYDFTVENLLKSAKENP